MSLASRAVKRLHEMYKVVLLRTRLLNDKLFHPSGSTLLLPRPAMMEELEPRLHLDGSPILVNTVNDEVVDDQYTSLREAITIAAERSNEDVILLPTGWYGLNSQLTIDDDSGMLSIVGIDGLATLDAQNTSRVMEIANGSNVVLENVAIANGHVGIGDGNGGGILNQGNLMLLNSTVANNTVLEGWGGGIYNTGNLMVQESTFIDNNASRGGGAIFHSGETVDMFVSGCTFYSNRTNEINGRGGAIFNVGSMGIANSTIVGNAAYDGGGIANVGAASVINDTIYDNSGMNIGGGISNAGTLILENTILSGNYTEAGSSDLQGGGEVYSLFGDGPRNNLIESPVGHGILDGVDGNIVGQPAMLDALGDNGGPTQTMLPSQYSPAVDNGNDAVAAAVNFEFDQRGLPRFDGTVDIGAVEAEHGGQEIELATESLPAMSHAHIRGGAVAYDGKIYVYTGYSDVGDRTTALEIYDPSVGVWSQGATIPLAVNGNGYFELNGKFYSIGGEKNPSGSFTNAVYRYDPALDQWETLNPLPIYASWDPLTVVCDGKAYLMGGRHGYGATYGHVYEYDEASDTWTPKTNMPLSVRLAGAVAYEGKVYVFGGQHCNSESDREWTTTIQVYDPSMDTWQILGDIPRMFQNTYAVATLSTIYIFSDKIYDDDSQTWIENEDVYAFTPATETWETFPIVDAPVDYYAQGPVVLLDGYAYFTGTQDGGARSTEAFRVQLPSEGTVPAVEYQADANTVALYHFNGDYADSSGNGRDLTVENPNGYIQLTDSTYSDAFGQMLYLTQSTHDWSNHTRLYSSALRYPGTGDWTVEALVFVPQGGGNVQAVNHYSEHWAGHDPYSISVRDTGDGLLTGQYEQDNMIVEGPLGLMGQWHHVAGVYDATAGEARFYANGVLVDSQTCAPPENLQDYNVYIGGSWFGITGPAYLDEIRISNIARGPEDFAQVAPLPSSEPEIDVTYDEVGERHDVNFGEVVTNEAQTFYIQVTNTGDAPLVVTDLAGLAAPFSYQLVDSSGAMDWTIESGGWREVELTFLPTDGGAFSDTLSIFSDDADELVYDVQLTGLGLIPPTVTATLPQAGAGYDHGDPNGEEPGQITVEFSAPMDPAAVIDPANYDLRRDTDNDGDFTDETPIAVTVTTADGQTVYLDTGGDLPTGEYEIQLNGNVGVTQVVQLSNVPAQWEARGLDVSDGWVLWGVYSPADPGCLLWSVWDRTAVHSVPASGNVMSIYLVAGGVAWVEVSEPFAPAGDLYFWDGQSDTILLASNVLNDSEAPKQRFWQENACQYTWISAEDGHVYISEIGGDPLRISEEPTVNPIIIEMKDDWVLWSNDDFISYNNLLYIWDGNATHNVPVSESVQSIHLVTGGVAWVDVVDPVANVWGLFFWDGQSNSVMITSSVTSSGDFPWQEDAGQFAWISADDGQAYISEVSGDPLCVSQTPPYNIDLGLEISDGWVQWCNVSGSDHSWYVWDGGVTQTIPANGYGWEVHLAAGGVGWVGWGFPDESNLYFWDGKSDPFLIAPNVISGSSENPCWHEDTGRFAWTNRMDGYVYTTQLARGLYDVNGILLDGNADLYAGDDWVGAFSVVPIVTATLPAVGHGYDHGDPNGSDPGQVTVEFSVPMDPTAVTNSANYILHRSANGYGDPVDDTFVVTVTTDDGMTAYLDIGSDLPTGQYQLTILGSLVDANGVLLDGDADGQQGGNWVGAFTMLPRPEIDVELLEQDDLHSHLLSRIDLGTMTSEWFTIRNEGDADLVLGSIEFGGDSPFTVTYDMETTTLAPGDTLQIQVHYIPTEQGRDVDTLSIYSNDADEPTYELAVTGEAVLPQGTGYYEVWGGNTDYRSEDLDVMWWQPYYNIDQLDYVYLGGSLDAGGVTEFLGSTDYDYYVIATRARVQVDAVQGSDGQYGWSVGDGNTDNWEYVYNPLEPHGPDGQYATVGYQGNSDEFCGFIVVENSGNWDSLYVDTWNIDLPLHVSIEQVAITDGTGAAYMFEHDIYMNDQGWSTSVRFQAPSEQWYDMWRDSEEDDNGWVYWDESFTSIPDMESEFGEGWYTVEASGSPFGTTTTVVWFGDNDGVNPLAWPEQIPEITNQTDVPTTATLEWDEVTDGNVTGVYAEIEDAYDNDWGWFWSDPKQETPETSFGPANLAPATNYEWDIEFANHHNGITDDEIIVDEITYGGGYGYHVERSLETSVMFRTAGEPSAVEPNLVMGEAFYAPGVYRPGETIDMDFLVGNLGDGNAVAGAELFYDEIHLSLDPYWSDDDVVIYRRPDAGWLGQEAKDTRNDPAPPENWIGGLPTIPLDVERGNYYVLACMDVHDQVVESDELDNYWISETPNVSVETLGEGAQAKHLLAVGVANPGVKFRGDVAAQRVSEAFEDMPGLVTNLLLRYNIDQAGNQQHLLDTFTWFESRILPGDQFIFYVSSQACYELEGNELAVEAQYDTRKNWWSLTETTTGDEYLYLSNVDEESNWLSDDKLALQFFNSTWAATDKVFILDTPYAGGFIGLENPDDESQWDLALLRFDPDEEFTEGQTERTQWASGTIEVIAAAGEGQFAFMTPEKPVGWAGVNRMGTHMIAPILAQAGPEHDVFDVDQLFWQTNEANSIYCNDVGMLLANADGNPEQGEEEDDSGGTVLDLITGDTYVQLGADVKAVRYIDPDGSTVTLSLNMGLAGLTFLGENLRQTFSRGVVTIQGDEGAVLGAIQLIDTTGNDTLTISVRGGDGFADLGGIIGDTSLGRLLATRVNLVGEGIDLEGDASIGLTRLHNIRNGADVMMAGAGPGNGVQFIAATVDDGTDMFFGGAIRTMYLTRWVGGSLEADYVRMLRVRKDMGADVTLTGTNGLGQSIFVAYVFGDVTGGAWDVTGAVRNWYVRGSVYGAELQLNDTITNLYVRGNLIDSAVHLADARIIRVVGRMDNSRLTSLGDIRTVIVGAMRNSTVFAGVEENYNLNDDGVPNAGRITHFQVRGVRGVENAFENSNLAAGSFGSVRLTMSTLENPVGPDGTSQSFGLLTGENGVDRLQLVLNRKSYFWRQHAWTRNLNPLDLAVIDTA